MMFNLEEARDLFIKELVSNRRSENTIKNYSGVLNRFIGHCENTYESLTFDTDKFQQAVNTFKVSLDTYSRGSKVDKKYDVKSINAKRSFLRKFIGFLYNWDLINTDFSQTIENLKIDEGKEKEVLSLDELDVIRNLLQEDVITADKKGLFIKARNRFLFYLLLYTGVREQEAARMKWSDIDLDVKNEISVKKGKGNKTRSIPVLSQLKNQIYDYKSLIDKAIAEGYNVESDYVITTYRKGKKV